MKSIICDICDKPFEPATPNQSTCTQCMLRPSRDDKPTEDRVKEKICVDCKKPYTPTGHCQKRCAECGAAYKAKTKAGKTPAQKPARQQPAPISKPVTTKTPAPLSFAKPLVDMLNSVGCDSIDFVVGDVAISVRRVNK